MKQYNTMREMLRAHYAEHGSVDLPTTADTYIFIAIVIIALIALIACFIQDYISLHSYKSDPRVIASIRAEIARKHPELARKTSAQTSTNSTKVASK